jgi:hypothetical protein
VLLLLLPRWLLPAYQQMSSLSVSKVFSLLLSLGTKDVCTL